MWAAYNGVGVLPGVLRNDTVNHSIQFINPVTAGADPGGGSLGSGDPPPPQHIREAKGMMCCYKNTKNVLFLELNVILAVLKESIKFFLRGCTHHIPYTLLVKTTLIRKALSICKHRK